jgi:ankyrin repeat protein
LIAAAAAGRPASVRSLLQARASVDAQNALGDTALIAAARAGNAEICSQLLHAGSNTRLRNQDKVTATDVANLRGFASVAQVIDSRSQ